MVDDMPGLVDFPAEERVEPRARTQDQDQSLDHEDEAPLPADLPHLGSIPNHEPREAQPQPQQQNQNQEDQDQQHRAPRPNRTPLWPRLSDRILSPVFWPFALRFIPLQCPVCRLLLRHTRCLHPLPSPPLMPRNEEDAESGAVANQESNDNDNDGTAAATNTAQQPHQWVDDFPPTVGEHGEVAVPRTCEHCAWR